MEIIPEGRHFRLVQESELPAILKHLERYLPESLKFHQTIKTYLNDRVWDFHFYVSKDWPEKPIILHFPGCTLTPNNNIYQSFGIFCPSTQIECVDLMRTEDVLIDWQKPLYLNFTHIAIMNRLDDFYSHMGHMERLEGDIYVCANGDDELHANTQLELEPLPADATMRQLTMDDVKAMHDLYPASEIECVEVFEVLVKVLPGLGVFREDTNELAAWMAHSYYGAMFSMQTRPDYRRLGYGIRLATALTKLVKERGYTPFVVIRPQNDASRNLYTKLGYVKAYETCRVKMTPGVHKNGVMNGGGGSGSGGVGDAGVNGGGTDNDDGGGGDGGCGTAKNGGTNGCGQAALALVKEPKRELLLDPEANKENEPIGEGIDEMLAEKCDIGIEKTPTPTSAED